MDRASSLVLQELMIREDQETERVFCVEKRADGSARELVSGSRMLERYPRELEQWLVDQKQKRQIAATMTVDGSSRSSSNSDLLAENLLDSLVSQEDWIGLVEFMSSAHFRVHSQMNIRFFFRMTAVVLSVGCWPNSAGVVLSQFMATQIRSGCWDQILKESVDQCNYVRSMAGAETGSCCFWLGMDGQLSLSSFLDVASIFEVSSLEDGLAMSLQQSQSVMALLAAVFSRLYDLRLLGSMVQRLCLTRRQARKSAAHALATFLDWNPLVEHPLAATGREVVRLIFSSIHVLSLVTFENLMEDLYDMYLLWMPVDGQEMHRLSLLPCTLRMEMGLMLLERKFFLSDSKTDRIERGFLVHRLEHILGILCKSSSIDQIPMSVFNLIRLLCLSFLQLGVEAGCDRMHHFAHTLSSCLAQVEEALLACPNVSAKLKKHIRLTIQEVFAYSIH